MNGSLLGRALVLGMMLVAAIGFAQPSTGGRGMGHNGPMDPAVTEFLAAQQRKGQAYQEQEAQEGHEFMATVADKPKAEKLAAIRAFKTASYEKNCAFRQQHWDEMNAFFAQRMGQRQDLPQGTGDRLARMNEWRAEQINMVTAFFAARHDENLAFLDAAAANPALDGPALDQALKEFFQQQKESARVFMQELRPGQRGGHDLPRSVPDPGH
jgi:hypothetical protein